MQSNYHSRSRTETEQLIDTIMEGAKARYAAGSARALKNRPDLSFSARIAATLSAKAMKATAISGADRMRVGIDRAERAEKAAVAQVKRQREKESKPQIGGSG